jgi:hypothetical protein
MFFQITLDEFFQFENFRQPSSYDYFLEFQNYSPEAVAL